MMQPMAQNFPAYKINHFAPGGNGYLMKRRARTSIPLTRKFDSNIGTQLFRAVVGFFFG
jgi:hypothetical protein